VDSVPENISDTKDWLNWNGDLDSANDSRDDCVADIEFDIEQHNSVKDSQCPEQHNVSAASNVPGLIWAK
jgi:hypothetical protein